MTSDNIFEYLPIRKKFQNELNTKNRIKREKILFIIKDIYNGIDGGMRVILYYVRRVVVAKQQK